jgi:hypothetical protein
VTPRLNQTFRLLWNSGKLYQRQVSNWGKRFLLRCVSVESCYGKSVLENDGFTTLCERKTRTLKERNGILVGKTVVK